MISTLYFIQLIAFYLWQSTAKPAKVASERKRLLRSIGAALLLLTAVGFIWQWGALSGSCGWLVGLMGVGCLSAIITPFQYIKMPALIALYLCFVALEIFI